MPFTPITRTTVAAAAVLLALPAAGAASAPARVVKGGLRLGCDRENRSALVTIRPATCVVNDPTRTFAFSIDPHQLRWSKWSAGGGTATGFACGFRADCQNTPARVTVDRLKTVRCGLRLPRVHPYPGQEQLRPDDAQAEPLSLIARTSRRAGCAVLVALACAGAAPPAAPGKPMLSKADRASFQRLERALGGRSGVAVAPLGIAQPVRSAGRLRTAVGWSTSKLPVAMAVVAGGGSGQAANLRAAITASDNAAAERLWSSLGEPAAAAAKATAQLRLAGDATTTVQSRRLRAGFSAFGQTDWRLRDQARFAAGMPCSSQGREVLALMAKVQPGQRWGLGSAGVPAKFKGGWGPGTRPGSGGGYVDRQLGIVTVANRSFAVSIATAPRDGSHATGTAHLTRIARWVVAHVDADAVPRASICG